LKPLKDEVNAIIATANEFKDDLIKQHGQLNEKGDYELKTFDDEQKVTEQFQEFWNKWNEHLKEEVELSYEPVDIKLIEEIETDKDIEVLFTLVD